MLTTLRLAFWSLKLQHTHNWTCTAGPSKIAKGGVDASHSFVCQRASSTVIDSKGSNSSSSSDADPQAQCGSGSSAVAQRPTVFAAASYIDCRSSAGSGTCHRRSAADGGGQAAARAV